MLGGWVKERASSLARLDRFDVSRLCVDKVDYTAGDTPPTGAGTTRVYSRSLSGPSVLQNSNSDLTVARARAPSVYSIHICVLRHILVLESARY